MIRRRKSGLKRFGGSQQFKEKDYEITIPILNNFKVNLKFSIIILCFFISGLFDSCRRVERDQLTNQQVIIQAGFVCGWGSATDSLIITKTEIRYAYYVPRLSSKPQIQKKRGVPEIEWTQIRNSFNADEFIKLNYNSCNVCFDGCDEWVSVLNDLSFHKITYPKGLKIDTISQLQLKLAALRAEFNP